MFFFIIVGGMVWLSDVQAPYYGYDESCSANGHDGLVVVYLSSLPRRGQDKEEEKGNKPDVDAKDGVRREQE